VISILFAVAWPVLRGAAAGTGLENECKKISATILYARDSAIAENRRYRLNFDVSGRDYTLSAETKDPGVFEPVGISDNAGRHWPENYEVPFMSAAEMDFEPDGSTDNFKMTIKDNRGNASELFYNNLKGKCEISKV
jgi:hypothetical protein